MSGGIFGTPPSFFRLTTGYLADYISDMKLSHSSGSAEFDADDVLKRFGLHSQMAEFSLSLLQRLEFYALLGGSKEKVKLKNDPEPPLKDLLMEFKTTYHFSWAAGMRIILLQWGQTFFSLDGSYFTVPSSHEAYFTFLNRLNIPLDENEQHLYLREWQIGAALSSRFWLITPYIGVKYLRTTLRIQEGPENSPLTYHNSPRFGYFFGATLSLFNKIFVGIERRVRDESAYMGTAYAAF